MGIARIVLMILWAPLVWGQTPAVSDSAQPLELGERRAEAPLDERVEKRLYPGGADESDLQVYDSVPNPYRQVNLPNLQQKVRDDLQAEDAGAKASSQ